MRRYSATRDGHGRFGVERAIRLISDHVDIVVVLRWEWMGCVMATNQEIAHAKEAATKLQAAASGGPPVAIPGATEPAARPHSREPDKASGPADTGTPDSPDTTGEKR